MDRAIAVERDTLGRGVPTSALGVFAQRAAVTAHAMTEKLVLENAPARTRLPLASGRDPHALSAKRVTMAMIAAHLASALKKALSRATMVASEMGSANARKTGQVPSAKFALVSLRVKANNAAQAR